jgi:hypothetical protein
MARYLELFDWTGRQLRMCDVAAKFGRIFKRAAGTPESLAQEAMRTGQRWLCALDNPLGLSSV